MLLTKLILWNTRILIYLSNVFQYAKVYTVCEIMSVSNSDLFSFLYTENHLELESQVTVEGSRLSYRHPAPLASGDQYQQQSSNNKW